MRFAEYDLPRGTSFVRAAYAKAVAGSDAPRYCADRWGVDSGAYLIAKAGVGASAQDSELVRAGELTVEFLDAVRQATAMDRLPLRRVPRNVPHATIIARAIAYWRGQGAAIKVSRQSFDRTTLDALTIGALIVLPNELLNDSSPEAWALIVRDVIQALAIGADRSFFDPDNAGVDGVEPPSICYVDSATVNPAVHLTTTGDLVQDWQAILSNYAGQLSTSAVVTTPKTGSIIGLTYRGGGLACDVGAAGGTLGGLPVYCTESLTANSSGAGPLIVVDGAAIVVVDEGAEIRRSNVAMLEMDDGPVGDSLAPTGAANNLVSMFQSESTALLGSRRINWRVARAGSVVVVTDADYSTGS